MAKSFAVDSPIAPAVATRFNLLGALSFSHFLNDMMQSLIVAIYPLAQGRIPPELRADRQHHAHLSGLRIPSAARHRHLYRPTSQAVFAQLGDVLHADRHCHAGLCAELRQRVDGGGLDWRRVCDLSPGILAHRAPGFRRTARAGAIDISGRRQCRLCHGTVARRLDHPSARPTQSCLVCHRRVDRHCGTGARRRLVQTAAHRPPQEHARFRARARYRRRECDGRLRCWCC